MIAILIFGERRLFFSWFVGKCVIGPDLPVGMRIAASHHLATVFEDLYMVDFRHCGELEILTDPDVNDGTNGGDIHIAQGEVMAGRETNHTAYSRFGLRAQKSSGVAVQSDLRHIQLYRCEVIVEDERRVIARIANSARSLVPWAQIAERIISKHFFFRLPLGLPSPWTLRAMRRHQHPVTRQRIKTAMGSILQSLKVNHESCTVISRAPPAAVHTYRSGCNPVLCSYLPATLVLKSCTASASTRFTVHPPNPPPVIRAP